MLLHPLFVFLLCFSPYLLFAQDALQVRSISNLVAETDDLELVFMNASCFSSVTIPDYDSYYIIFSNIKFAPKSFDMTTQDAIIDTTASLVNFSGNAAVLTVNFTYLNLTEMKSDYATGDIIIRNISNSRALLLSNEKPEFLSVSVNFEVQDVNVDPEKYETLRETFKEHFMSNAQTFIKSMSDAALNCLNNWVYPVQSQNFLLPYQYHFEDKTVNYSYEITSIDLMPKFMAIWYKTQIDGLKRSKYYPLSPSVLTEVDEHTQSLFSKTLFYNTFTYALEQNFFDLDLNEVDYPSDHFYYFIGELALFIPELRNHFFADDKISGSCKVSKTNATYDLVENAGLYASLPYYCEIKERTSGTDLFSFQIHLNFTLKSDIKEKIIDFSIGEVVVVDNSFIMNENQAFPQTRPEIINYHIGEFMKEMYESTTFGSKFKINGDQIVFGKDRIEIRNFGAVY